MKQLSARIPPVWRFVAVGLVVSAAGAFGIVNMASAHSAAEPPGPHHEGRHAGRMPGLPLLAPGPALDHLLDEVQATPEQREQLRRIADNARSELRAGAESRRADRQKLGELFAQPVVDEAAVEALRRKMVARHDEASKQAQAAMLQVSRVLTPEQRLTLVAQLKQQGEPMGRRHRHAGEPHSAL